MQACETMGGANCICSDKTGTLTQNKMNIQMMWNGNMQDVDAYTKSINLSSYIPEAKQDSFIRSTIVNNSSDLFPEESGSATDIALLKFIHRCGVDIAAYRQQ